METQRILMVATLVDGGLALQGAHTAKFNDETKGAIRDHLNNGGRFKCADMSTENNWNVHNGGGRFWAGASTWWYELIDTKYRFSGQLETLKSDHPFLFPTLDSNNKPGNNQLERARARCYALNLWADFHFPRDADAPKHTILVLEKKKENLKRTIVELEKDKVNLAEEKNELKEIEETQKEQISAMAANFANDLINKNEDLQKVFHHIFVIKCAKKLRASVAISCS